MAKVKVDATGTDTIYARNVFNTTDHEVLSSKKMRLLRCLELCLKRNIASIGTGRIITVDIGGNFLYSSCILRQAQEN